MSIGNFANETGSLCTAPLLDETLFPKKGGYLRGRYCGLGAFEVGASEASCCFPCPIQDWIYPPDWKSHLRVPNYLSILSVILCTFLLLSFFVLPPAQTHRHYLSVGLLIPVLLISLSFAIPVSTNPSYCADAITPAAMRDSLSCAWTGSLVTLGGLGCVIWVFLRSLWLFVRIVYDVAPGRRFMFGSIATGTLLPVVFLVAVLTSTGYSYRMGPTCLPNHENAIATFWIWLVVFAILGFVLQAITTAYCVWVYFRSMRRTRNSGQRPGTNMQTWANMKKLFVLQWRNILVSVFVLAGSLVFFIVFWTQDAKLGRVFNDPENIKPVKTWIICQTLSRGDKTECRKYVNNFTINEPAVLTSLILASLIGIEIFILLFRRSMLDAWITLLKRCSARLGHDWGRPPTPELTSFENPEKYSFPSPNQQNHGPQAPAQDTPANWPLRVGEEGATTTTTTTHTRTKSPKTPPSTPKPMRPCQPLLPHTSSTSSAALCAGTPTLTPQPLTTNLSTSSFDFDFPDSLSLALPSPAPLRPHTVPEASFFAPDDMLYHPSRPVPELPARRDEALDSGSSRGSSPASVFSSRVSGTPDTRRSWRDSTMSALGKVSTDDDWGGVVGAGEQKGQGVVGDGRRGEDGTFVVE